MHGTRNRMTGLMLGLVLLWAGGCASADRYVYESPSTRSATVVLVDALDDETLWTRDVPAEHRLIIRLKRTGEPMAMRVTGQPATSLAWALYESPNSSINDSWWRNHVTDGNVELHGRPVRLEVVYHPVLRETDRPEPETPSDNAGEDAEADDAAEAAVDRARRAALID